MESATEGKTSAFKSVSGSISGVATRHCLTTSDGAYVSALDLDAEERFETVCGLEVLFESVMITTTSHNAFNERTIHFESASQYLAVCTFAKGRRPDLL